MKSINTTSIPSTFPNLAVFTPPILRNKKTREEERKKWVSLPREMGVSAFKFLCFTSLLLVTTAISATVVPLGSIVRPTNPNSFWPSPNQTFSVRFITDPRNPSLYLAAITLSTGQRQIRVWTATTEGVDSGGSFQLQDDGNLLLSNGSGAVLWQTKTSNRGVSSGEIDDFGNFALKNGSFSIWESFDYPTDTLLTNQNFSLRMALTSEPYSFSLIDNGNQTLRWNNSVVYYNHGLNSTYLAESNVTIASPTLVLQSIGSITLSSPSLSSDAIIAYSSDYGENDVFIRYLRLDSDGNLRAYSTDRSSGIENVRWNAVSDQCDVFGWCGNMGICTYNDTEPICQCPSRDFVPTNQSDPTKGCRRIQEIQDCPGNYTMLQLDNTQFLTYMPDLLQEQFNVGITACSLTCLNGGSCVASTALADGSGICYLKSSSFISGYLSPALPSTSFVKVCGPGLPNPVDSSTDKPGTSSTSETKWWVIVIVVAASISGLVLLEWGLWWCFCRNSPRYGRPSSAQYALIEYASGAPIQFSYKDLRRATKGFKEKLGEGGFGSVYRGVLANRTVVAVKQLEGIEQGEKQFRMEVATISSTHHLNLVQLIGFCSEGRHRLLVYEFMKNGSLDNFLFSPNPSSRRLPLPWDVRYRIAVGMAKGITYLHEECRSFIIHCDIKPENILLDDNYNAKVSDFGLAKLINPRDHRHRTLTSVRGTRGYLAPEWLANLPITTKSDVFSFGMVLLEIVSGKRNFDLSDETSRKKFSTWAYEEFEKGNVGNIIDRRLVESETDVVQVERVVRVSFWCVQEQPSQRPTMGKVVQMLEGIVDMEKPPAPRSLVEEGSVRITGGSFSSSTVLPSALAVSSGGSSFSSRRNL